MNSRYFFNMDFVRTNVAHIYFNSFEIDDHYLVFENHVHPGKDFHYDDISALIHELEKVDVSDIITTPCIIDISRDYIFKLSDDGLVYFKCYRHGLQLSDMGYKLDKRYIPCFILNLKFLCRLMGEPCKNDD